MPELLDVMTGNNPKVLLHEVGVHAKKGAQRASARNSYSILTASIMMPWFSCLLERLWR